MSSIDTSINTKDYTWWEGRARDSQPLTEEEKKVIYSCGGLSYIRTVLEERGPGAAMIRTISNKHYMDCPKNCICGRNFGIDK